MQCPGRHYDCPDVSSQTSFTEFLPEASTTNSIANAGAKSSLPPRPVRLPTHKTAEQLSPEELAQALPSTFFTAGNLVGSSKCQ